jgi:hypothetical protein
MSVYSIIDGGGIEVLAQVCLAQDRVERLCQQPCLRDELQLRAFISRNLELLGLNVETVKLVGHPTRPLGWIPPGR